MNAIQVNTRHAELRALLDHQRQRLVESVREAIHTERSEGETRTTEVADVPERSEANVQSAVDFALAQIRSEMLANIDRSLENLDRGEYGRCLECGDEISPLRLKALPFAVRCRECAETAELTAQGPVMAWHRGQ
jgi:DnaK suppressor protein